MNFMKSKFALNVLAKRLNQYEFSDDDVADVVLTWINECEAHSFEDLQGFEKEELREILSDDFLRKLHVLNDALATGGINSRDAWATVGNFISNLQHVASTYFVKRG